MRSLLLSRLSRLCLRKPPPLGTRHLRGAGFFTLTSRWVSEKIGKPCDYNVFSPEISVAKGRVNGDLVKETIGASHGWVATLKDGVVCLQGDLNPNASDSNPKRITLPPLVTLPHCQTQLVTSVAMSSFPEDKDCIVAVKFVGPQLSLCRLAQKNPEWVNYKIKDPSFSYSRVMYSKRDKMFKMPASGGTHIGCWDLEKHITQNLFYPRYTKFSQSEWERVSTCCKSEHLVEASGPGRGDYMVKWYTRCCEKTKTGRAVWERFSMYRIMADDFTLPCTDIGDESIFLSSQGEPFCLQASLYGFSPNCIYYVASYDFGKVNISDNVRVGDNHICLGPYFFPPQP